MSVSPLCVRVAVALMLMWPAAAVSRAGADSPARVRDLLTSARHGDLPGIARALAAGADENGADPNFQQTALMRAAMFGQAPAVAALLKAGASTSSTSDGPRGHERLRSRLLTVAAPSTTVGRKSAAARDRTFALGAHTGRPACHELLSRCSQRG